MPNFNRVILAGHLTRDVELTFTPANLAIGKFGLAVNHKRKDKDEVCFVDCVAFGKQAETLNQYMAKGRALLVEGRLQLEQWTAKDGTKRSKHSVVIDAFTFLGGKDDRTPGTFPASESLPPLDNGPEFNAATDDGIPF